MPGDATRPAGPGDVIAGVPARRVAAPGSTAEAADVLRAAAAEDLAVVVRGAGTRRDWAAPPRRLDLLVDTAGLAGVVEHAAGDLVAVVRAGTALADAQAALAAAGQQIALDAPLPGATVGGTVAADVSGPRRHRYGTVRDQLIGVTVVRPDGTVARAGGRVVKNVAGYDLGKLYTGSYGTLGLITECVFRLHPLPAARAVVTADAADPAAAAGLLAAVQAVPAVPSAVEVDAPPDGGLSVAVLVEGSPAGVRGRAAALARALGPGARQDPDVPDWFGRYPWPPDGAGIKLTARISRVPAVLTAVRAAARRHGVAVHARGAAGVGVLHAGLPAGTGPAAAAAVLADLRAAAHAADGHAVVLTAPAGVRERLDLWGPVPALALMRRVKDRFDPDHRFAPGRFVGGI